MAQTETLPDWDEVADILGHSTVRALDKAISEFLVERTKHGPIPKDEMYLVTEGVTYAACLALIREGV